jgi:signal transduction histidine kinase
MSPSLDRSERLRELVSRIVEAEAELQELTAGELDAVVGPDASGPLLLRSAQEALRDQAAIVRLLQAVSSAANESRTLEEAAGSALREVCRYTGWRVGHLYRRESAGELALTEVSHDERARAHPGSGALREVVGPEVPGTAGRVARTAKPAWMLDLATTRIGDLAAELELHSAFAFPVLAGAEVVGVLEFLAAEAPAPSRPLLEAMELVGVQLGRVVERSRAEAAAFRLIREQAARAAAEEAGRRNAFLASASEILHSSLDYESTLRSLAQLMVPEFAEWCFVDLVEEGGGFRRVAVAHADPAASALARALERVYEHREDARIGVARVIRTGRPEFSPAVGRESLDDLTHDPQHARHLRELNVVSYLSVPLEARGRILGALTLVSTTPGHRFEEEDLGFHGDLARRAAVAVDNARLYREVQEANRAKADFLAVMSHELRTPLNAVLGYSDLLTLGIPRSIPDEAREQVERIALSARHLLELIDEILTHSRLETGREEVRIQSVQVGDVVAGVTTLIEPLAQERGLDFEVSLTGGDSNVRTDGAKVRQILLNLLSNAVKYTDEGEVRLAVEVLPAVLRIEVRDTGIGISRRHHRRVFEPFWQVEQSNTRRGQGTGLGLAIVHDLVRLMGGELHLDSEPGRGTTFTIELPLQPADSSPS